MNTSTQRWITPEIFKWEWRAEASAIYSGDEWRRPYAHWQHAEGRLQDASSEFTRTDIVTTLKRALDHRFRALMALYDLKAIPVRDKPDGYYELMEWAGMIRPKMTARLIDVRNAVEHADAPPPEVAECEVFVEFAWYFLRSTDRWVRASIDGIEIEPTGIEQDPSLPWPYGCRLRLGPDQGWAPKVDGRFRPEWVSESAQDGWLTINASKVESGTEMIAWAETSPHVPYRMAETVIEPSDLFISGEVRGPAPHLQEIVRRYFDLL